jgi:hypothetical protein
MPFPEARSDEDIISWTDVMRAVFLKKLPPNLQSCILFCNVPIPVRFLPKHLEKLSISCGLRNELTTISASEMGEKCTIVPVPAELYDSLTYLDWNEGMFVGDPPTELSNFKSLTTLTVGVLPASAFPSLPSTLLSLSLASFDEEESSRVHQFSASDLPQLPQSLTYLNIRSLPAYMPPTYAEAKALGDNAKMSLASLLPPNLRTLRLYQCTLKWVCEVSLQDLGKYLKHLHTFHLGPCDTSLFGSVFVNDFTWIPPSLTELQIETTLPITPDIFSTWPIADTKITSVTLHGHAARAFQDEAGKTLPPSLTCLQMASAPMLTPEFLKYCPPNLTHVGIATPSYTTWTVEELKNIQSEVSPLMQPPTVAMRFFGSEMPEDTTELTKDTILQWTLHDPEARLLSMVGIQMSLLAVPNRVIRLPPMITTIDLALPIDEESPLWNLEHLTTLKVKQLDRKTSEVLTDESHPTITCALTTLHVKKWPKPGDFFQWSPLKTLTDLQFSVAVKVPSFSDLPDLKRLHLTAKGLPFNGDAFPNIFRTLPKSLTFLYLDLFAYGDAKPENVLIDDSFLTSGCRLEHLDLSHCTHFTIHESTLASMNPHLKTFGGNRVLIEDLGRLHERLARDLEAIEPRDMIRAICPSIDTYIPPLDEDDTDRANEDFQFETEEDDDYDEDVDFEEEDRPPQMAGQLRRELNDRIELEIGDEAAQEEDGEGMEIDQEGEAEEGDEGDLSDLEENDPVVARFRAMLMRHLHGQGPAEEDGEDKDEEDTKTPAEKSIAILNNDCDWSNLLTFDWRPKTRIEYLTGDALSAELLSIVLESIRKLPRTLKRWASLHCYLWTPQHTLELPPNLVQLDIMSADTDCHARYAWPSTLTSLALAAQREDDPNGLEMVTAGPSFCSDLPRGLIHLRIDHLTHLSIDSLRDLPPKLIQLCAEDLIIEVLSALPCPELLYLHVSGFPVRDIQHLPKKLTHLSISQSILTAYRSALIQTQSNIISVSGPSDYEEEEEEPDVQEWVDSVLKQLNSL